MGRVLDALLVLMGAGLGPVTATVAFTEEDEALSRKIARRWAKHYLNARGGNNSGEAQADLEIDIILAIKEFAESDRHRREALRLRDQGAGKPNHERAELQ